MSASDSIRYTREAKKYQLAAKIATFLESYVPPSYYSFVLCDLLYFTNEQALSELRQNTIWQALESQFTASGGLISEFWDEDEDEAEYISPPRTHKPTPTNRKAGLVIATILSSAIVGSLVGWFYPWLTVPTSEIQQQSDRRVD